MTDANSEPEYYFIPKWNVVQSESMPVKVTGMLDVFVLCFYDKKEKENSMPAVWLHVN